MKIAVNVQTLVKNNLEGLGWFTYESIKRIVQQHPEHEFVLFFGKGVHQEFIFSENVKAINIGPPFFRPLAWFIKFEFFLNYFLKKHRIELFISSDGFCSTKIKIKNLLVIHDLNFEENPEWLPKSFSRYYRKYFPKWARNATRIATVSEYSKNDINRFYKIPLDKIDVVYNGSNDSYKPISIKEKAETKQKYTSGEDFFVFIGSIHPRKNLAKQLSGFELFKSKNENGTKFLIVGNHSHWKDNLMETYQNMKFKDDVIFTGHLQIEELHKILASSIALVYVSLFEGFGIPIVEAMNAETAIITANVTSMPEVAGDAALLVNPNSKEEISEAMLKLYTDSDFKNQLIEKGKIQKQKFSWDKTAERLWKSIEKVLHE